MTLMFNSIPFEIHEALNNNILSYNIRTDYYTHSQDPSVLNEENIEISLQNKMIKIRRTTKETSSSTRDSENISIQSIPFNNIDNIILDLTLRPDNNYKSNTVKFLFLQNALVVHEFNFSIQLLHIPKEDIPKIEQIIQNIHESFVREMLTPVSNVM
ncbi:hypothetical protein IEE_05469 [Bacillus cereus BAG5X1-1]|uniref:Uncharacterized protein n=1 Tax=Bacillus cereus BAG5X1-1 TaxID=1053189 RepID=J7WVW8_BACCE|nr:hypothetical protein [Bacillus cereus]EJQ36088.1 hypothetical protein IEE_05469 [Bacillus cereus BAG5X1-1]